jgi:predicted nucleic acid-binding Zn ribbon protein
MGRLAPRPAGEAIRAARERAAPPTGLAAVQAVWAEVVGPAVATATEPSAERGGALVVRCKSAVWAQELEMMAPQLLVKLRARLGQQAPRDLRFESAPGWPASK